MGQSVYSSANGYIDGFVHWVSGQRIPASGIQWGAVAGVGMAARTFGRVEDGVSPREVLVAT